MRPCLERLVITYTDNRVILHSILQMQFLFSCSAEIYHFRRRSQKHPKPKLQYNLITMTLNKNIYTINSFFLIAVQIMHILVEENYVRIILVAKVEGYSLQFFHVSNKNSSQFFHVQVELGVKKAFLIWYCVNVVYAVTCKVIIPTWILFHLR